METAIEFFEVSKSYGSLLALDHVSFVVPAGEICGFLGPNGAGKTTSIRILLDLIRPSLGRASVFGHDCQRESIAARRLMGYLPGDLRLYENLSGLQLFEMFASMRDQRSLPSFAMELCGRLGLDPHLRLGNLSKGNKQKAGLVLALMHRPRLLVLDEPTSGLDPLVQEEVGRILGELAGAGHAVFFSSHDLAEVERLCHQVIIIRSGRVVAHEDVADLKGRSLHIVEVTFSSPVPWDAFRLPGVEETRRDGSVVHLQIRTNLDGALKAIARYPVLDLRTEQPSLEDIFLAYYRDERQAQPREGAVRAG